jgi:hypothetical protein
MVAQIGNLVDGTGNFRLFLIFFVLLVWHMYIVSSILLGRNLRWLDCSGLDGMLRWQRRVSEMMNGMSTVHSVRPKIQAMECTVIKQFNKASVGDQLILIHNGPKSANIS